MELQTDDLLQQVTAILGKFSQEDSPISGEMHLMNDLELDSVKVMELMMVLEDHFDISIPLNILPNVNTVSDLANEIANLKQKSLT